MTCIQDFTAPAPTGPDWSKLHWIATGKNTTGTIFLNGVNIPNGNPIVPTDCGTQSFLNSTTLMGDVDHIFVDPIITFNSPGTFNCRAQITIFAVATEPQQHVIIIIANDTIQLLNIDHLTFSGLAVGTHNFDFVVPPNGGHLDVSVEHDIFNPGLAVVWKLTMLNL